MMEAIKPFALDIPAHLVGLSIVSIQGYFPQCREVKILRKKEDCPRDA